MCGATSYIFFNTRMCSLQEKGDLQILTPHFRNFQRLVQLIRCPLQLLSRLLSMQTERVTFSCNMGQSFRPPKFNQLLVYFIEGHQSPRSPLIFGYDIGLDMFACFFRMVVLVLQLIDVSWVYIGLHCKKSLFCPRCDGLGGVGLLSEVAVIWWKLGHRRFFAASRASRTTSDIRLRVQQTVSHHNTCQMVATNCANGPLKSLKVGFP